MTKIIDFLQSIGQFFSDVWDIVKFIGEEIASFFRMLKPAADFFLFLLNNMPVVFIGFGVAMLLVLILYVILGRTAGGD